MDHKTRPVKKLYVWDGGASNLPDGKLRWGTEQRLEFIEFCAFWDGGINRGDITERFGVSVPQASNDLTLYQRMAPTNLKYDASLKRYVATSGFCPKFMKPNADRYLAQLKAIADRVIKLNETWITGAPEVDAMPIPHRQIEPVILKTFITAIRGERSIEVYYQSMNPKRPDTLWRRITPHAFAHDGLRWHVRAFCHIDRIFKDFILSRCRSLRDFDVPGAVPSEDRSWITFFDVLLTPNPDLAPSQRETIALDYGMVDGQAIIPVRRALLYYFEKRLRLDIAYKADTPAERPVVIANQAEFTTACSAALTEK